MAQQLTPELETTDRLLDVWGRDGRYGVGGGLHPLVVLEQVMSGEIAPSTMSADDVMIVIDQCVLRSPDRVRRLLHLWYRTPAPSSVKAARLGISRTALYTQWNAALWFMRGSFRGAGLHV